MKKTEINGLKELFKIVCLEKNFNCPKCNSEDFNFGISGSWD